MPRYELMYILASTVSDDQVPAVASQIVQFVTDFGGTEIEESQLGKKKLAYPIKKTRNGFYGLVSFMMEGSGLFAFDAKIRTQNNIIRYIIVNMDEHIARSAKDVITQSKIKRIIPADQLEDGPVKAPAPKIVADVVEKAPAVKKPVVAVEMNAEELDKKIDDALNEDIIK